jgi:hypothetical protein
MAANDTARRCGGFEKLPPETPAWLCIKDKYNLPMFSDVCQVETKTNSELQQGSFIQS